MTRNGKGDREGSIESETSEWLAVPAPGRASHADESPRKASGDQSDLRAELEDAEREIERGRLELEEMRDRIRRLEDELKRARRQESRIGAEAKPSETVKAVPKPVKSSAPASPIDLNAVSYEDLRAIGLSVTDSARVIAYREVRDGLGSVDELSELPELPADALDQIRSRTRVST
jgi:DNA uptake protein ComE-like DNA-binding protein